MSFSPLITPQGPDFIKNWPFQNGLNCDNIDAFTGPQTVQNYTPIITAAGGGLVLGTGATLRGHYYSIFNTVYAWGEFRFGTGFALGTGFFEATLPFAASSMYPANTNTGHGSIIGVGRIWRNSTITERHASTVQLRTLTKVMFNLHSGSGARSASGAFPFAWTTLDGINWNVRYLRADV